MQATTIKIENPLLSELKTLIPKTQSLTSFIRETLEREVRRQKMIQSGEKYAEFLKSSPEEVRWLEEWESSDLEQAPKTLGKKRKS